MNKQHYPVKKQNQVHVKEQQSTLNRQLLKSILLKKKYLPKNNSNSQYSPEPPNKPKKKYVQLTQQMKKSQLVIERRIKSYVYSFNKQIFMNKDRFKLIESQPSPKHKFEEIRGIYKGRYLCKNPKCRQVQKSFIFRENIRTKQNEVITEYLKSDLNEEDEYQSDEEFLDQELEKMNIQQRNFFKRQDKKIHHQQDADVNTKIYGQNLTGQDVVKIVKLSEEQLQQRDSKNQVKLQKTKPQEQTHEKTQLTLIQEVKQQQNPQNPQKHQQTIQKLRTQWSSCLSYVIMHYSSYPVPLHRLKQAYQNGKTCEIYYYIEILGQKCQKCKHEEYSYPFFQKSQLNMIRRNFADYFYDLILNDKQKTFYRERRRTKGLVDHKRESCEACQRGECREKGRKYLGQSTREGKLRAGN